MAGARRTDRISERDLEVLEFVVRFGVVPRDVVAMWARTGRAVTAARERRLRVSGLIEVLPGFGDSGRLILCKRAGLRAVGLDELPEPNFSASTLTHSTAVARVAVGLEHAGNHVLSEREIFARERAEAKRIFSAERADGPFHRPDLILLGDPSEAIEVELTAKAPRRLDQILRAWRRAVFCRRFSRVRYLCWPQAQGGVERAVERLGANAGIVVEGL